METPSTEHREMSNGPGPPPCVGAGPGAGGCQLLLILLGLGLSPPSGGESDPGHPEDAESVSRAPVASSHRTPGPSTLAPASVMSPVSP